MCGGNSSSIRGSEEAMDSMEFWSVVNRTPFSNAVFGIHIYCRLTRKPRELIYILKCNLFDYKSLFQPIFNFCIYELTIYILTELKCQDVLVSHTTALF